VDRHRFDFVSLVFGVTFATLGVAIATGGLRLEDTGSDPAIPLLVGFVGLVLAALTLNHHFRTQGGDEEGAETTEPLASTGSRERDQGAPDRT
jgi:hypothetical protein